MIWIEKIFLKHYNKGWKILKFGKRYKSTDLRNWAISKYDKEMINKYMP